MKKDNLLISIIIPTFNREEFIAETLNSIHNQTSNNWECIIVDDGSIDNTIQIINKFIEADNRFQLLLRKNMPKGASACRNIGAENSKGNYIVFLDSDDLISPQFIENRLEAIKNNQKVDFIVYPSFVFKQKVGDLNILYNILDKPDNKDISRFLDNDNPWHTTGPVWKKSSFWKIGGFNIYSQSAQDWEIHMKALIHDLDYIKIKCNNENIHHFIRNGEYQCISKATLTESRIKNRMDTFQNILTLFQEKGLDKTSLKNKLISHFYRQFSISYNSHYHTLTFNNLDLILKEKLIKTPLKTLLKNRLILKNKSALGIKIIDLMLYRIYSIKNIDFPYKRTKGTITLSMLNK